MDRNAFVSKFSMLLDSISVTAAEIADRHWALMVASDDTFYLGDNPAVLQRTENPRDGSNLGFDVTGVEAFFAARALLRDLYAVPGDERRSARAL